VLNRPSLFVSMRKAWSRRLDSNPQPPVYKTGALPLSYTGAPRNKEQLQQPDYVNKNGGSPGTRTLNQLIKSQLLYH
jgi:hypothetical protein